MRTTASGPQSAACVVGVDGSDSVVSAGRGVRVDAAGSSLFSGTHTLTASAAGDAPARLNVFTSVPCKRVWLSSSPTNPARIVVGDSTVMATNAAFQGIPLDPGQGIEVPIDDVNEIYFNTLPSTTVVLTWQVVS